MKQQIPHTYFGAHRRRTRDRWALGAGHPVYGWPQRDHAAGRHGRPSASPQSNRDFRDASGRLLPAHIVLASLHSGILRDIAAFLSIIAFVAAVAIGAGAWVGI